MNPQLDSIELGHSWFGLGHPPSSGLYEDRTEAHVEFQITRGASYRG
jgi:hypothetical protein